MPAPSAPAGDEHMGPDRAAREVDAEAALLEDLLEVHGPYGCERCHGIGVEPGEEDIDCADCGGAGQIASLGHPKFLEHVGLLEPPDS